MDSTGYKTEPPDNREDGRVEPPKKTSGGGLAMDTSMVTDQEINLDQRGPLDENTDVVIFLSGYNKSGSASSGSGSSESSRSSNSADSKSSGSSGYVSDFETMLRRELDEDDNVRIRSYVSDFVDNPTKSDVREFVKENLGENGRLIIVGYSWGGDTALELAEDYESYYSTEDYEVIDLLITIDPADGPGGESNTEVARTVSRARNYYQEDNSNLVSSGGRRLTPKNWDLTKLDNILITETAAGEAADHYNIYNEVMPRVVRDVLNLLRSR